MQYPRPWNRAFQNMVSMAQWTLTRLLGPRPGASWGSVQSNYKMIQEGNFKFKRWMIIYLACVLNQHKDSEMQNRHIHIKPSVPGCLPTRGIRRMSSNVTSSWLKRPPCTTKYRLKPSAERIPPFVAGGLVALTNAARGTVRKSVVEQCWIENKTHVLWRCAQTTTYGVNKFGKETYDLLCSSVLHAWS